MDVFVDRESLGWRWIAPNSSTETSRIQLRITENNLYDGNIGIALLFAALHKITAAPHYADWTYKTLLPIQYSLIHGDSVIKNSQLRQHGVGGLSGLGSIIYGFTTIATWLNDNRLLQEACQLTELLTVELIQQDNYFDIISGTAGTLLSLLKLYKITKQSLHLEKALQCGYHLLQNSHTYQIGKANDLKVWFTIQSQFPITGFAHGNAGIAYALLKLYEITQNKIFLTTATQSINFEHALFSAHENKWSICEEKYQDRYANQQDKIFCCRYCYGASGIGLARAASIDILNNSLIQDEIDSAVKAILHVQESNPRDNVCCGNFGRFDALLEISQRIQKHKKLSKIARQKISNRLASIQEKPLKLFNQHTSLYATSPSFFIGTAGIAYQCLRVLSASHMPCILLLE